MMKIWNLIKTVWKDPVWSKVISVVIIAGGLAIWAWIEKKTPHDLYVIFLSFLNSKIPLYLILSLLGIFFLWRLAAKYLKKKPDQLYSEMVGHYTFSELAQILQDQSNELVEVEPHLRGQGGPTELNLIVQLMLFKRELNMGVTFEIPQGSNYLYADFCPKMMTYGLIDKIQTKHDSGIDMEVYQLSELGKKFISLWERHLLKVKKDQPAK